MAESVLKSLNSYSLTSSSDGAGEECFTRFGDENCSSAGTSSPKSRSHTNVDGLINVVEDAVADIDGASKRSARDILDTISYKACGSNLL